MVLQVGYTLVGQKQGGGLTHVEDRPGGWFQVHFLNVMYRYSRWVTELSGILETEVLSKGTAYESELRWWCGRSG